MKVGKITDELRDLIIEQNDLEEVAEEYGIVFNSSNKASCPFHQDGKNGNLHLHVKNGKKTYHCYKDTCSAGTMWEDKDNNKRHTLTLPDGEEIEDGGPNVIGFVMNIERCSYIEACVILMNRAGIPVPEGKVDYKQENYKKKIHRLNVQYCKNLFENKEVMKYVLSRGVSKDSIRKWRMGYIPEGDKSSPMGSKASGRLVFGLAEETYDVKGARSVAMAYRTLKDEQPKYYNDYTVDGLYEKKFYLYGLNEARKAIKKAGYAIIVEGYMDTIIAHQSEISNTVATCGTAFTKEQMMKLRRLTRNLVFWYDGDSAGVESMLDSVPDLLELGFRVKIIIAKGKDPAEWMNKLKQNRDAILRFISKNAKPALQVLANQVAIEYQQSIDELDDKNDYVIHEKLVEALDQLLPIYKSITDEAEKIVFRHMVNTKLGVNI